MHTDHTTNTNYYENTPKELFKCCSNPDCDRFGQLLALSEFNVRKASPDGYQYRCRNCSKKKLEQYRKDDHGKSVKAKNQRDYRRRPNGLATDRKGKNKYRKTEKGRTNDAQRRIRDKEKIQSRTKLNYAVKSGVLPNPKSLTCTYCQGSASEYHHFLGYSPAHALDVVPVCKQCHATIHFG